ncbi:DUF7144 family membrane protein [Streptomyces odontomachi]|uniref:DUF7144 family membrane protein n=1 Tax=Streptomyces odontomachi TaxID=2944940 RepID=UPI00210EFDBA|nr:hypothetical protein [Streptomyces sp. ODS25]
MAQTAAPRTPHVRPPGTASWARGGTIFAGILLLVDGMLGVVKGIAGIISNNAYTRPGNYVYSYNVNSWGWLHLGLGVVLALAGLALLTTGARWARMVAIAIAALSLIANFIWLPFQPIWAIVSIAIDTFVIWAVCTDRRRETMG